MELTRIRKMSKDLKEFQESASAAESVVKEIEAHEEVGLVFFVHNFELQCNIIYCSGMLIGMCDQSLNFCYDGVVFICAALEGADQRAVRQDDASEEAVRVQEAPRADGAGGSAAAEVAAAARARAGSHQAGTARDRRRAQTARGQLI